MSSFKVLESETGLQVAGLRKSFKKRIVIHDVSLELRRGEVVALLGPNGSGKTTTFYSIAGLTSADGGQVKIDGLDVTTMPMYRRARMGLAYLPQETSIFRGLNVEENIQSILDISTPIKSHYSLIKKALLAKKHVFVEKPLCTNSSDANELIQIAKKEYIHSAYFQWNKFGTFDEDIFFNLLSHDISIVLKLFGKPNKTKLISSLGFISKCDLIILNLAFQQNKKCQIYLNRCSSNKKKTVTLSTNKNIYFWDDSKLFKYNKKLKNSKLIFESKLTPLENECKKFINELKKPQKSLEYANLAKDVIQVIQKLK